MRFLAYYVARSIRTGGYPSNASWGLRFGVISYYMARFNSERWCRLAHSLPAYGITDGVPAYHRVNDRDSRRSDTSVAKSTTRALINSREGIKF